MRYIGLIYVMKQKVILVLFFFESENEIKSEEDNYLVLELS